jgi:transposase InsO family protein
VERILWRAGLCKPAPAPKPSVGRFERSASNELWQADFKGLGEKPHPFRVLSVIDDCSRFLVDLTVVPRATNQGVFDAFWEIFGNTGLPDALLTDNEGCFHTTDAKGPSFLECRLWRLGIKTPHGRARHPQTQGKVERFHRTLEEKLGPDLRQSCPIKVQRILDEFRNDYNWNRPHDSLLGRKPGAVYTVSSRKRPAELPPLVHSEGAELRRVDANGRFMRKGVHYYLGRGLIHETVAIVESERGLAVEYAQKQFALLEELRV